jgi:hypothetical protein
MGLSERLLKLMRLRLTGKRVAILPPDGDVSLTDPAETSLVGGLAPRPDPEYHREQPPCAMGMVLMVQPDATGKVEIALSGRFDVTHRYIPTLDAMRETVQVNATGERNQQKVPDCFKRFTVEFSGVTCTVDIAHLNTWSDRNLQPVLEGLSDVWKNDARIFRACHVNDRGYASLVVPWSTDQCTSDEEFYGHVANSLFIGEEVLQHDVVLRTRLRPPPPNFDEPERYLLEIYLQNNTETITGRGFGLTRPSLLDVQFEATLIAGRQYDVPHRLAPEDYRYQPEDGVAGYGVTCAVEKASPNRFQTDSMPVFAQARIDTPSPEDVDMTFEASFSLLMNQPLEVLDGFVAALEKYDSVWISVERELEAAAKTAELQAVRADRKSFDDEVKRIADGVELLRKHEDLRRCFCWMNEAMSAAIHMQGKSFDSWHLFQLGFILTQVRAIYERHSLPNERQGASQFADVLWFSTGGGKTEAYLGIIVFAMLYCRVKGRLYGATAWMRFPLRMLSAQQFQRLSYVVAQAEVLRCREGIKGHPFTVGYYTGGGTPGRIGRSDVKGSDIWLADEQLQLDRFRFITDCPYCGTKNSVHMVRDLDRVRMKHCCSSAVCWSRTSAPAGEYGEGISGELGIYVSDEECYRYLPTVLVGTIDKLAVIAHNERFAGYLGAFRYFCPEHGFTSESKCKHQRIRKTLPKSNATYESVDCGNNSRTSKIKTLQLPPMLDPGFSFLIQDELHLLRESLGNFDAHYETLLQALQEGHGGQSSKVLAATATIKDFENHLLHLYVRPGRRFPAPGALRGESFYARISRDGDGPLVRRWFAGVLPLTFTRGGTERTAAEVASRYLDQIDEWYEGLSASDPAVLAQCGFTVERANEVGAYIGKFLSTDLIYANQKRQTTAIREHLDNVNTRDGRARTHRLLDGQTPLDEILDTIHEVETKTVGDPMRHLVATSVVSHGVDIAELNFMVLDGWPRSTAEYIQSSARSGRVQPGIVMSILSAGKLFESGVFLNFGDYHFFLDKLVDSVPINRFAPNVLQRTLPGVFSAVVYNWAKHQPGWGDSLNRYASQLHKSLNDGSGIARQNLRQMLIKALDVPPGVAHHFDVRVLSTFKKQLEDEVDRGLHRLQHLNAASADKDLGSALESIYQFPPMRSFRDIENQVEVLSAGEKERRTFNALGR